MGVIVGTHGVGFKACPDPSPSFPERIAPGSCNVILDAWPMTGNRKGQFHTVSRPKGHGTRTHQPDTKIEASACGGQKGSAIDTAILWINGTGIQKPETRNARQRHWHLSQAHP